MTIDELIDATKKCRDSDTLGELNRMKDQGVLDAIMHVGSCNKKTQRALLHHFTGITDRELKKNGVGDV